MRAAATVFTYLLRDSGVRWRGRVSVPLSRLATAVCLAATALLVFASFALAAAALRQRIAAFGLDALVIRQPLDRISGPAPDWRELARHGRMLDLKLPYATARLDNGDKVPVAVGGSGIIRQLAALGVPAHSLPLLLGNTLPAGMPLDASVGPASVRAITAPLPAVLQPLGQTQLLLVEPGGFPLLAATPGVSVSLLVRSAGAPPLADLVAALQTTLAANPDARTPQAPTVDSALPLLRELQSLQTVTTRYTALIALALALTIALVFAAGAILEFEATAYTTALLRSFGVRRRVLWCQRAVEALLLANLGGLAAWGLAVALARFILPQLLPFCASASTLLPVFAALNAGALLATLPVALALRRPVGVLLP